MPNREYWEVGTFIQRPNQARAFFQRLGSALQKDDGGFTIYLNALPIPNNEGSVVIVVSPPREQRDNRGAPPPRRTSRPRDEIEDEIPF